MFEPKNNKDKNIGLFAIRGSLEGEESKNFIDEGDQFIGLKVSNKIFLLKISLINEIVMMAPITYVPQGPKYVDGVMNLRGTILPAINMRRLMGQEKGEITPSTRVVIVNHEQFTMGLIIDEVAHVISLKQSDIENKSLPSQDGEIDLISSVCRKDDSIFGVIDPGKIATAVVGHKIEEDDMAA